VSQVKNKFLAQAPTLTLKGNNTGSTANETDLTVAQVNTMLGDVLANGTVPMTASLNLGSNQIINVTDPTTAQMVATKNYVDEAVAALNPQASVYAATTGSNIPGAYINGAAGVGATFTTTATTTFTLDGTTPPLLSRILIKDQSSGFQNGIYTFTTAPVSGVSGAVFTRALDYDTASDMNDAGLIPVLNGTLNALTSWQQVATITTVGTDALVFTEFTANPSLYVLKANNLSDVASASAAFNNISPMTTLGDTIYESAPNTAARLPGNITTTKEFLTQTGTGSASAAPAWATIVAGDIPTLNQNTTGTAGDITATSNSTLTTLSALSLPAIQLTGTLAASQFPALTGDVTTTAGSLATTLATVNSNTGSFGSSTSIPSFTVNGKGLITAASGNAVVAPAGTLSGTTLNSTVVTSSLTSVGTIATGVWNGTTIAVANGGTGDTSFTANQVVVGGTTTTGPLQQVAGGTSGFVLTSTGTTTAPTWQASTPTFSGLNSNGVIYAPTSTTVASTTVGTAGQVLTSNGTGNAPTFTSPATAPTTVLESSNYSVPSTNYIVICSGPSFNVTLPDATVYTTGFITIKHNGTSLSQVYTLLGTSGQTVDGVTSGSWGLWTKQESVTIYSNGTNWEIEDHFSTTGWINDTTATVQFYTFTIASGSFSGTIGATYTNNGNTYTLSETFTTSATSIVLQGPASPTSTGTLTNTGGTHVGNPVFTAVSGGANNIGATTTAPIFYGAPTKNQILWRRQGSMMTIWFLYYQATAGASSGSGDYIFPIPTGVTIDTSIIPVFTGGTAGANQAEIPASTAAMWPYIMGRADSTAPNYWDASMAAPYTNTSYRVYGLIAGAGNTAIGSGIATGTQVIAYNWQVTWPITGFQP